MASLTASLTCSACSTGRAPAFRRLRSRVSLTPRGLAAVQSARGGRCRAAQLQVVAYREVDKQGDWRIQKMVDMAHSYFTDYISGGKTELAEQLFDDDVVHKDLVWDSEHPVVGIKGMKSYLSALKGAYPDFWVEIDQIGTCDVNSIFVTYEGSATNLGEYHSHRPTHHTSNFQGCNLIKFNDDRTKIKEIIVYRSAFMEDKLELSEKQLEGSHEIRLRRLI